MKYDFDKKISRRNTDATKWTKIESNPNSIPMWLADMDIPTHTSITEALVKRAKHPIYGYTDRGHIYNELIAKHFNERHNYKIKQDEIFMTTGVVYSMCGAIRILTKEKDKVIVHTPVYPPFKEVIEMNNRIVVESPMKIVNGKYTFDFDNLRKLVDKRTKMFMLCNPQNPTGRVFDKDELTKLSKFCEENNLYIVSDEIHADFIFDDNKMMPILNTSKYARENSITCVSCSKSFNLAGLKVSAAIIPNEKLRKKFIDYSKISGIASVNIFALEALKAAYTKAEDWQKSLVRYLNENRDYALNYFSEKLPKLKILKPEGTYFLWIDFSEYGIADLNDKLFNEGKVLLNDGEKFGKQYKNYQRLNFACTREQLSRALDKIWKFVEKKK